MKVSQVGSVIRMAQRAVAAAQKLLADGGSGGRPFEAVSKPKRSRGKTGPSAASEEA